MQKEPSRLKILLLKYFYMRMPIAGTGTDKI